MNAYEINRRLEVLEQARPIALTTPREDGIVPGRVWLDWVHRAQSWAIDECPGLAQKLGGWRVYLQSMLDQAGR